MRKNKSLMLLACLPAIISGCNNNSQTKAGDKAELSSVHAPKLPDTAAFKTVIRGQNVGLYILKNKTGDAVAITNYGGRLVSLIVPDKNGKPVDVILGHDSIGGYIGPKEFFFGAIIGRYGNRIAKGRFTIDNKTIQLDVNDGPNSLHGGFSGFYNRVFKAKKINEQKLELSYLSKDGEGGYPGNLAVSVTYTLTDDNALKIDYTAKTDKNTVINLTNHAYFNLNGAGSKTVLGHILKINADQFTPVDSTLIPTGILQNVKGTPFDFTVFKTIGADIDKPDGQLKNGKGYDHNFVLNKHNPQESVTTLKGDLTGITMDVFTTEPGVQFYSGNFLTGSKNDGKGHEVYGYRSALCLETQHFPDSPNQSSFPSTELKPGETYRSQTIYKFSK
jgi:aldose 1-epimerase